MYQSIALATLICLSCITMTSAEQKDYLKAFPKAAEHQHRFVLRLPHKDRQTEGDFRVEIFVGKIMETDGVNRYWMGKTVEKKPLKGWGFEYYELDKFGPVASTQKAVPPGTKKKDEFVHTQPLMIRYNSRVPIVVYAPQGAEVRYRIWTAGDQQPMQSE